MSAQGNVQQVQVFTSVVYRKVADEKKPKTFSSGVVKEYAMDSVVVLAEAKVAAKVDAQGKRYVVEAAIPLAALGLKITDGLALRGDFSATHGDKSSKDTMLRSHWNNQTTGIVNDEVFELRMGPANWGKSRHPYERVFPLSAGEQRNLSAASHGRKSWDFLVIWQSPEVVLYGDNVSIMNSSPKDLQYDQFVSLFARQERAVRGFVRSLLPSWQDVDDVMQEVGLACWRKFDAFESADSPDAFLRWACVIAQFEVLRYRRNCARDRLVFSEDVIEILAADAQVRLEKAEVERKAVEHCLAKLQEPERRLLLSVHTPGDSVARIAADTGQKARRLYRKVNALRDLIGECVRGRMAEGEA